MKKYLMTAAAALALSGMFIGCTHDTDFSGGSGTVSTDPIKTYEQAFLNTFGQPVDGLDWGFGSSSVAATRAMTRALNSASRTMPQKPTFRDTNPITKPTDPTKPSFSTTRPQTATKVGKNQINASDNHTYYVNAESGDIKELNNRNNVTIYTEDDITYKWTNSNNGNNIIVTEGNTLRINSLSEKVNIYLAPNAHLIFNNDITLKKSATLYLSSGSSVQGKSINFDEGYQVINDGGTITATSLGFNNNTKLWNDGTVTLTGDFNQWNEHVTIYNANGKTISAANVWLNKNTTVWNDGTITASGTIKAQNDNVFIYNGSGKTISAAELILTNNYDLLYNDGSVTVSGNVALQNSSAEIVNNNTLTISGNFSEAAGGKMHNVGTVTVTGETTLTNSNSWWMNDGQYTTGTMNVTDYGARLYNNCRLIVNGNFHLNRGLFVVEGGIDGGASVICDSFTFEDTSDFWLGSQALLSVKGKLLTNNGNSGYGFHGVGNDYAVIKAGEIARSYEVQFSMTYYGKLFIDTETHFEHKYFNQSQVTYDYDDTVKFSFNDDASPITIPSSTCTPGYNPGTPPVIPEDPVTPVNNKVRVIAEDLQTEDNKKADFDFNDVVFDVELSGSKVIITLQAAGGTLPLTVGDIEATDIQNPTPDKYGDGNLKREVHHLFKVSTSTMVNTNAAGGANVDPYTFEIDNNSGSTDVKAVANWIPIRVYKMKDGVKQWIPIPKAEDVNQSAGKLTSCKLAVDGSFAWCAERIKITEDSRYQYLDDANNNLGSRFELYLQGRLSDKWWKEETKISK